MKNCIELTTLCEHIWETMAMVYDPVAGDIIDKEYKDFTAEMYAEGHSFFTYISDSADSLASCCFSGGTKVLWKEKDSSQVNLTSLQDLYERNLGEIEVFHNGSWVLGKSIKLPGRTMYHVTTSNGKDYLMTDNHINLVLHGKEKKTEELTTSDWLMYSTTPMKSDNAMTYEQGYVLGCYLSEGRISGKSVSFLMSETKYKRSGKIITRANHQLGEKTDACLSNIYNDGEHLVVVNSQALVDFINTWITEEEKTLNLNCLIMSSDFRRGILNGLKKKDGGNFTETVSEVVKDCLEVLTTSLGLSSKITLDSLDGEYPLWTIEWNDVINDGVVGRWINNCQYFKITSIEKVEAPQNVYCIECSNQEEPFFTLPSGLITHNCRLRNELAENTFSPTSGLTGVMTGSCNVISLNISRIVQQWYVESTGAERGVKPENTPNYAESGLREYLINILERVYKYHITFKTMLYDMEDRKMFATSNGGYISISKLYSTVGINGLNEAARFLGFEVSNNPEYIKFLQFILGTVKEQNKLHSIHDKKRPFLFNSEVVPAEGLGGKNYNWDKADNFWVPEDENLYNSYFYNAHDNTSVLDKFILHGKQTYQFTDGGWRLNWAS